MTSFKFTDAWIGNGWDSWQRNERRLSPALNWSLLIPGSSWFVAIWFLSRHIVKIITMKCSLHRKKENQWLGFAITREQLAVECRFCAGSSTSNYSAIINGHGYMRQDWCGAGANLWAEVMQGLRWHKACFYTIKETGIVAMCVATWGCISS